MTQTRATPVTGGRLTAAQGTALYVGAVLGTGVIALPALAAEAAGPASLLAWLLLVLVSAPLAATFAALGSRHPDAGGVSTYARSGLRVAGERPSSDGVSTSRCHRARAAALFGAAYVEAAVGGGTRTVAVTAVLLMVAVTVTNHAGVQLAGRVQLALAGALVVLLLLAVLLSLPHTDAANLTPFAPRGLAAVGPAAALLMWSFVGWEAITHLTGEFRRPERDLPRATAAAVVVVGALYLAVAFATVAVLGSAAADSTAPLGELFAVALGGDVRWLVAGAALLLTFGAMNAYYAGAAKLGAALGRDGALPAWLARGSVAGEVPRRSLAVTATLALLALGATLVTGLDTHSLVLVTTGSFSTVYVIGVAAALRLLPRRSAAWYAAAATIGVVLFLLAMTGVYLLWPVAVTAAALLYLRVRGRIRS